MTKSGAEVLDSDMVLFRCCMWPVVELVDVTGETRPASAGAVPISSPRRVENDENQLTSENKCLLISPITIQ